MRRRWSWMRPCPWRRWRTQEGSREAKGARQRKYVEAVEAMRGRLSALEASVFGEEGEDAPVEEPEET